MLSVPENFKPEWNTGQDALWAGKEVWHGLAKALEYLGLPDVSQASDAVFDKLIYEARNAQNPQLIKLRNVKDTEWGKPSGDYKHDPLYSVGHNQDRYVRKMEMLRHADEPMRSIPFMDSIPLQPIAGLNTFNTYGSRLEQPADLPIEYVPEKNIRPVPEITQSPAWTRIGF